MAASSKISDTFNIKDSQTREAFEQIEGIINEMSGSNTLVELPKAPTNNDTNIISDNQIGLFENNVYIKIKGKLLKIPGEFL